MAKKDYAAELAELRECLEKAEREAAAMKDEAEKCEKLLAERTAKNARLTQALEAAKAEVMRVKAHAYDLMMEQEQAETA